MKRGKKLYRQCGLTSKALRSMPFWAVVSRGATGPAAARPEMAATRIAERILKYWQVSRARGETEESIDDPVEEAEDVRELLR